MFRIILVVVLLMFPGISGAREIPMWEGVKKTQGEISADRKLLATVEQQGGRRNGATRAIQLGWKFIESRNPDMAIKRFNQAWLLDPSNANIYWGFAIALHQQRRPISEVNRFFSKAESGFSGDKKAIVDLFADQGQVYGERKKFKESIKAFEKALALDPWHTRSRRGILISANAIRDSATLKKYR